MVQPDSKIAAPHFELAYSRSQLNSKANAGNAIYCQQSSQLQEMHTWPSFVTNKGNSYSNKFLPAIANFNQVLPQPQASHHSHKLPQNPVGQAVH